MTRDMDLIRALMKRFAEDKTGCPDGCNKSIAAYHVELLAEAGLVEASIIRGPSPGVIKAKDWVFTRVTWKGHDFISLANNDTVWARTMQYFREKSISWTIDLIMELLKAGGPSALGLNG